MGGIDAGAEHGSGAHPRLRRVLEGWHDSAWPSDGMVRKTTGHVAVTGVEQVVAQFDGLAGDVVLVAAATIVVASHASIGGRSLRPVQEAIPGLQHLSWMVAGWQADNKRRELARTHIGLHDARRIVALAGRSADALVGIDREQCPAGVMLERQTDRWAVQLVAGVQVRVGRRRLEEWT